ncbi:MAG: hypothetical protein ACHQNE_06955 [Candidatus Kapaibacterium sp.]
MRVRHMREYGDLTERERYEINAHYPDAPQNTRRQQNAILHVDTVLYHEIWVDPGAWSFLRSTEDSFQAMIVPPFKINGKPYYKWLVRRVFDDNASLPKWIIPDSTLIRITYWCYYSPVSPTFCWPITDEIETIKRDHRH